MSSAVECESECARPGGAPALRGKIVAITGAAGGFGRALATAFARECASLALLDINGPGLDEGAQTLRAGKTAVSTAVADLSTAAGTRAGFREALAPYDGQVDILVSNVGVLVSGSFEEISDDELQRAFDINFFAHVRACREVLPLMKGRQGANIVLMGSDQGRQPDVLLFPYAQAKAALHSLGKLLAREYAPEIRVNVVAPGMSATPLVLELMATLAREKFQTDDLQAVERMELEERQVPLRRLGRPEEIAEAVLYLATAGFVTGTCLDISGGNVRGLHS